MASDYLPLVLASLALLVAVTYSSQSKQESLLPNIPWVGRHDGMFSGLRTRLKTLGGIFELIETGYREFSQNGHSFILPDFSKSIVLVPGSHVKWITEQSDEVLNAKDMQRESLEADLTLLDPSITKHPIHEGIIKRDLTRNLGSLIPEIMEELSIGVDEYWGTDDENWKETPIFASMLKIVSRTSNRIFVGLPLCRNDDYLDNAASFSQDIAISSAIIKLIPNILRPVLAWIFLLPNRWHHYKCSKHLVPFIQQRAKDIKSAQEAGSSASDYMDFTTWFLREAETNPDPTEREPEKIALRIMTLNFAAIHTSTFTATNMLFDLYSSPPEAGFVKEIREEIEQALAGCNGKWNKIAVANLIKIDSALRESLRISTFMAHGMDRLVVDPKGITMSDGLFLPHGTRIGTATHSIHHDNSIYENAQTYDAFRFARMRETATANSAHEPALGKEGLDKVLESRNLSTVTTSDTYLSFGHGRHACPGRFFAATEMKLLLAHIIMNYDIKPLGSRPPNKWIGGNIIPPMKSKLSVRRRRI